MRSPEEVICDYCGKPAELVVGTRGPMWQCTPCGARIAAHISSPTFKPVGRLANAELRAAKKAARDSFDPIIRIAGSRRIAFRWLSEQMKLTIHECHVDLFDVAQCEQMTAICKANLPIFAGGGHE